MSAGGAPSRYVSVSELYSADEVELLLEEIRELEPTSCRGEELADFEIAGSGAARSPAPTERSWDSHAHYARGLRVEPRAAVPLYCRLADLAAPHALLSLLLVACGVTACACVWAVTGLRGRLPLDGRARLLALGALSSALVHGARLVGVVTRLAGLLPWRRAALAAAAWSACSLATGGALVLHALLATPEYRWAPEPARRLLLAAAGAGLAGAAAALGLAAAAARPAPKPYRAVPPA